MQHRVRNPATPIFSDTIPKPLFTNTCNLWNLYAYPPPINIETLLQDGGVKIVPNCYSTSLLHMTAIFRQPFHDIVIPPSRCKVVGHACIQIAIQLPGYRQQNPRFPPRDDRLCTAMHLSLHCNGHGLIHQTTQSGSYTRQQRSSNFNMIRSNDTSHKTNVKFYTRLYEVRMLSRCLISSLLSISNLIGRVAEGNVTYQPQSDNSTYLRLLARQQVHACLQNNVLFKI